MAARSLGGKVVLVTGGARGIGRGIAEACAEAEADVAVGDLDQGGASETARLVEAQGRRALALRLDVTDPASVEAALAAAAAGLGRLDGLVNNAGVLRMDAALDAHPGDFDLQLRVNTQSVLGACQAAARTR